MGAVFAIWRMPESTWSRSLKDTTIRTGCTPPWVTSRRWNSKKHGLRRLRRRSFSRHEEIYPVEGRDQRPGADSRLPLVGAGPGQRTRRKEHVLTHRLDEFPTGYSWAGCSPAGPASAFPADHERSRKAIGCPAHFIERLLSVVSLVSPKGVTPKIVGGTGARSLRGSHRSVAVFDSFFDVCVSRLN